MDGQTGRTEIIGLFHKLGSKKTETKRRSWQKKWLTNWLTGWLAGWLWSNLCKKCNVLKLIVFYSGLWYQLEIFTADIFYGELSKKVIFWSHDTLLRHKLYMTSKWIFHKYLSSCDVIKRDQKNICPKTVNMSKLNYCVTLWWKQNWKTFCHSKVNMINLKHCKIAKNQQSNQNVLMKY